MQRRALPTLASRGLALAVLGFLFSCGTQQPSDDASEGSGSSAGAGGMAPVAGAAAGVGGSSATPSAGAGGAGAGAGTAGVGGAGVPAAGASGAGNAGSTGLAGAGAGGVGGAGAGGSGAGGAGGSAGQAGAAGSGASFQPCPTTGEPCKILPLGDSITAGLGAPGGGGYRVPLFQRALAANQSITFVGSQSGGPAMVDGAAFPDSHEGHSGRTISFIAGRIPEPALDDGAHVVLLMIGTNDMYMQPTGAPDRLADLLDEILELAPDALLVVAQLTPFPAQDGQVQTYNAAIPALVEQRADAGEHIVLVDMYSDFPESLIGDGVHPNAEGYALMADRWYAAIDEHLRAAP
jgi:lysophospholipase L1-like esterase